MDMIKEQAQLPEEKLDGVSGGKLVLTEKQKDELGQMLPQLKSFKCTHCQLPYTCSSQEEADAYHIEKRPGCIGTMKLGW